MIQVQGVVTQYIVAGILNWVIAGIQQRNLNMGQHAAVAQIRKGRSVQLNVNADFLIMGTNGVVLRAQTHGQVKHPNALDVTQRAIAGVVRGGINGGSNLPGQVVLQSQLEKTLVRREHARLQQTEVVAARAYRLRGGLQGEVVHEFAGIPRVGVGQVVARLHFVLDTSVRWNVGEKGLVIRARVCQGESNVVGISKSVSVVALGAVEHLGFVPAAVVCARKGGVRVEKRVLPCAGGLVKNGVQPKTDCLAQGERVVDGLVNEVS